MSKRQNGLRNEAHRNDVVGCVNFRNGFFKFCVLRRPFAKIRPTFPELVQILSRFFSANPRLTTAGKYFRKAGEKVYLHGVTYGPFGPGNVRGGLGDAVQTARDLEILRNLGVNALRVYHPPDAAFLDACQAAGVTLLVGIPWLDHVDFLGSQSARALVRQEIAGAARALGAHPAVGALFVGNEISTTLARWQGTQRMLAFVEELVDVAHQHAPQTLVSYANYPSTEFLVPENADFVAFNLYLDDPQALRRYLARLHNLAGDRPVVISEFGVDAKARGAEEQARLVEEEIQVASEAGVAGNFLFSFTDEWFRGGGQVDGWAFGLTEKNREPRPAASRYRPLAAPLTGPAGQEPKFSVIVCTRNGSRTLRDCLQSLVALEFQDRELLVVDDGSSDTTPAIVAEFPEVIYIRQAAAGLSVARNTGAEAAKGQILAYTDDDCVADPHWLNYLAVALADEKMAAAGGPNVPPPPLNAEQACVVAAPGGPAHVLLGDSVAEHVPGCNLAVRKEVWRALGGFLPKYHAAGDDVDFCWRLLARGWQIAFHGGAMVWHYRRFELAAYLRQQQGYGKAEGLLIGQYGSRFGHFGGAQWKGVVYQTALAAISRRRGRIYSGPFGHAPYQLVYSAPLSLWGALVTSVPWLAGLVLLAGLACFFPQYAWGALVMLVPTLGYPFWQAWQLPMEKGFDTLGNRLKLAYLLLGGPVLRSIARFWWGLRSGSLPAAPFSAHHRRAGSKRLLTVSGGNLEFWNEKGLDRNVLLPALEAQLVADGWTLQNDDGWREWDLQVGLSPGWCGRFATVTEYHGGLKCLTRARLEILPTPIWWAFSAILVLSTFFWPLWGILLAAAWGAWNVKIMKNRQHRLNQALAEAAAQCGLA